MWKNRIYYIVILMIAGFLFLWTNTGAALLLLLLLLLFPLLSGCMTGIWMHLLQLEMVLPEMCVTNQETDVRFLLTKKAGWMGRQLTVPVMVRNRMFNTHEKKYLSIFPGYKRKEEYRMPVNTEICGEIEIQIQEIRCYDFFQLFCVKKYSPQKKEMVIYPEVKTMNLILKHRPKTKETGDIFDEDVRGNDMSEIFDLRGYQDGDSIRSVHWKLSSKMNRLLVREFSRPASFDTILLFSLAGGKEISNKKITRVASLSISIMEALLKLNMEYQVGCMLNGTLLEMPVCSRHDCMKVKKSMMSMQVTDALTGIIQNFMKMRRQYQYTKVIYITANPEDTLLKSLANQVNLSVIVPVEGKQDYTDESGGYEVIALSEKKQMHSRYIFI